MRASSFVRSAESAFTLVEMILVIALIGILSTAAVIKFPEIFGRGAAVVVKDSATALNVSSQDFLVARGTFPVNATAEDYLTLLQTPVDAVSIKAGFGDFTRINHHWTFVEVDPQSTDPRITLRYDPAQKRPVWGTADTGEGFKVALDPDKQEPATADWTAYVDGKAKISQTGARHTAWLWDTDEDASAPALNKGANADQSTYGPATGPNLSISGPAKVTTAGVPIYWTGVSSISGTLSISIDGAAVSRVGATSIESNHKVFPPGERSTHTITLTRIEGGSITRTIEVDIPDTMALSIDGPDTITTAEEATWTATSSEIADPILIKIEEVVAKAEKKATVSATHPAWAPGTGADTPKQIKITASAMNAGGVVNASKIVTIQIPVATIIWRIEPDIGPRVEINGSKNFIVSATANLGSYTGPFDFDASLSSSARVLTYGPNDGSYANPPALTDTPASLSATKVKDANQPNRITFTIDDGGLDPKARLAGTFTGTANLNLPGIPSTSNTELFNIAVPRLKGDFRWTVTVSSSSGTMDPAKITSFQLNVRSSDGLNVQGSPFIQDGGVLSRDFDVTLPIGEFVIWGEAKAGLTDIPGAPGDGNSNENPIHFEVLK